MGQIKCDNKFGFKYREINSNLPIAEQRLQINTLTHNAIFFQLEGELLISWGQFRDVKVRAGEFYFLPRGASVSACIVGDKVRYIVARLEHDIDNSNIFREVVRREELDVNYSFVPLPIVKPLEMFLDSLIYYVVHGLDCQRLQNIKFLELYVLFHNCYKKEDLANLLYPILENGSKFKTFILDNYKVDVTIKELAEKANMSRSTFDRTFKDNFGMTPHKWFDIQTYVIIQRKASEPNVTVKDIMYEVGVYNSSQFTKLCKRLCGITPSQLIGY